MIVPTQPMRRMVPSECGWCRCFPCICERAVPCQCGGAIDANRTTTVEALRAHQRTVLHQAWRVACGL